jgi:hypothetical protein
MSLRHRRFLHFKKSVDTGNQGCGLGDVATSLARSGCGTGLKLFFIERISPSGKQITIMTSVLSRPWGRQDKTGALAVRH